MTAVVIALAVLAGVQLVVIVVLFRAFAKLLDTSTFQELQILHLEKAVAELADRLNRNRH